jgi:putative flippase GtrA
MSDRTRHLDSLLSRVRFGKFVSVGAIGAVCDTIVLLALVEQAGLAPEIANVLSIETAILVMFGINENWTFAAEDDGRGLGSRLLKSHAVRASGSLVQYVIFVALINFVTLSLAVRGVDVWLVGAKWIGIGVGMVVNYVFESLFTWKVHTGESG